MMPRGRLYFVILLTYLITSVTVYAQDSLRINVIANVKKDTIQLRWAVNTPMAWKLGNQYGYRLERYTIVRNNEILSKAEKTVLVSVLKPQPQNSWESLANKNNYAAVIAQALFGEKFQLTGDDAKGVSKFIALAQELEQRFMISMYAADMCYPAARLAGWGYDDVSAKPGERYLYRVIPLTPEKVSKIEMGSAYVSLNEYQPLPQPQELTGIYGDKSVMLTWNYGVLSKTYISYYVEKSHDGKTFTRLSDIPLTNMNTRDGKLSERMFYIDSVANNNSTVYYRVRGVTSFSETGPPSDIISGKGVDKLIYVPHINRAVPTDANHVDIDWEFDERGNDIIKGFELWRADNDKGPFKTVVKDIVPGTRSVSFDSLKATNYFVIAALPHHGEPTLSFPVLVQPVDTIPPVIPTGLTGVVDSLGIVTLSWNKNTDKDILGYRVYRAQNKNEELIPLTDVAIRDNTYRDTIEVRNLNSKIYYAVTALDQRYNQSAKSSIAVLDKPELVPPSAPLITNYRVTPGGVLLQWETGGEESIASIKIYRTEKLLNDETAIKEISNRSIREYIDSTALSNQIYKYYIKAFTSKGLSSDPSPLITVKTSTQKVTAGTITLFTGKMNWRTNQIELKWEHDVKDVKQFEIYRGEAGSSVSLWKVVKGYDKAFVDIEAQPGHKYEYIIRAILSNGKTGAIAKTFVGKD